MSDDLPDWVVLGGEVRAMIEGLRADVERAAARFREFDDVRQAIAHRDREVRRLRDHIAEINKLISQLNLIAPHVRFRRGALDADAEVALIERSYFRNP